MSQHVIVVRVDMNGLYVKKSNPGGHSGTYGAGAKWPIEEAPESLINKAKENITFNDPKTGNTLRAISFMTSAGNWIGIEDAYIPKYGIGKKPTEPEINEYTKSKKERNSVLKTKEKDVEPPEIDDLVDEEGDGTPETPKAVVIPKKEEDVYEDENSESEENVEEETETGSDQEETSAKSKIVIKSKKKKKSRG